MDHRADLAVGGPGGDDDLLALRVRPAARTVGGQLPDLDDVAELAPEVEKRGDQVGVTFAFDRLRRRHQRHGLRSGQRVAHPDVEDRDGPEEDALLAGLLSAVVALLDGDWYWRSPVKPQCRIRLAEAQTKNGVPRQQVARRGGRSVQIAAAVAKPSP
jgi:hypothetical protein